MGMDTLISTDILPLIRRVERENCNSMVAWICRGELELEVHFMLKQRDFKVTLDVEIVGEHKFWVQANTELTEQDKDTWLALVDLEFEQRQEGSEMNAKVLRRAVAELTEGL